MTLAGAAVMARPAVGGAWDPSMLSPALWIDPSDLSTVTISGSSGAYIGPQGLVLPGTSGNVATTADSAAVSPTTAVEIVARARATWSASVMILAKRVGGAETSLQGLQFGTQGGALSLFSNNTTRAVTHALTDGAWYWLKVTADGTATRFYFAADQDAEPSSWTQVGTDQGASSFVDTGHLFSIGGDSQSGWYGLNVKRLILRKTIGGSADFDADFTAPNRSYAMSFTEGSTNAATVTITSSTNGAAVSQINDKSGNSRHLTQGTLANMPALQRVNGKPVLVFAESRWMDYDAGSDTLSFAAGITSFIVAQNQDPSYGSSEYRRLLSARRSATGAHDYQSPNFVAATRAATTGYLEANFAGVSVLGSIAVGSTVRCIVSRSGASAMTRVNGTSSPTMNAPYSAAQRYVRLGADCVTTSNPPASAGPTTTWLGSIGEVIVVPSEITDGSLAAPESYLSTKWGTS